MAAKIGFAEGRCGECGKTLRRKRPASFAVCDCYLYCSLCDKRMNPYSPDLGQHEYDPEKGLESLYVCSYHLQPFYSKRGPVEVRLR